MSEQYQDSSDRHHLFRIAWYGVAVMVIVAYAVLFPLKWYGLVPVNMTWSRTVLGPPLLGSLVPLAVGNPSRPDSYGFVRLIIWILSVVALSFVAALFDLVAGCP
jgi:hypothetical protein